MNKKLTLIVISVLIVFSGIYSFNQVKRTAQAYVYGYPLVLMELTRQSVIGKSVAENQIVHSHQFPDHNFRAVVRPNNDTLYSIAWLNLKDQPLVLTVPDTAGRYYVMPLMDAWTNVFANIGKREYGTKAGKFLITGPDWSGAVPAGLTHISAPTNMSWMIGRIQTNGTADIPNVIALQTGFTLTNFSDWPTVSANISLVRLEENLSAAAAANPSKVVDEMRAAEFFDTMLKLMSEQAVPQDDAPMLRTLAKLDMIPGRPYEFAELGIIDKLLTNFAVKISRSKMRDAIGERRNLENGWAVHRSVIGQYADNYKFRAGVSMLGLGALEVQEAAYPNARVDSTGQSLSGSNTYRIHFEKGQMPPVNAFWSLTMYDQDGFLVESTISRYFVSDRDELNFNDDGSLDVLVQHQQPTSLESINWLPAPKGDFELTLRLYHPKQAFLNGTWVLPPIEKR